MSNTLRMLRPLFAATFIFLVGNSLLNTLLSTRMAVEGFSLAATGMVLSWYFMGLLAGSFLCYRVIQKVGHLRAFTLFAAGTIAASLLHGLYMSPLFWGALRFLCGITTFGLFVIIESWLYECSEKPFRGRMFSIYLTLSYLGIGIGQQFINFGNVQGSELFIVAGIVFALCLVPLSTVGSVSPQLPEQKAPRFLTLFHRAPRAMLGSMTAGLTCSSFYAMMPVACTDIGMTPQQMSWIMTLTVFSGLAVQYVVGSLSDQFSHSAILNALTAAIALISGFMFINGNPAFWHLAVEMSLIGALIFAVYPVSVAYAYDRLSGHDAVAISNGLLYAFSLGACI